MNESSFTKTYLPKKSNGGIWSIGFLIGILLLLFFPSIPLRTLDLNLFMGFIIVLPVLLVTILGITIHGYYSMKYIIQESSVVLKWSFFKREVRFTDLDTISTISDSNLQGIRTFGVGIPGHLVGKFRIKLDGEFFPITLYATKVESLIILRTLTGKIYGITPAMSEDFINTIRMRSPTIQCTIIDTHKPIRIDEETLKQSRGWITFLYLSCLIIATGSLIFMIIVYQNLPEIIPLHWGINGLPDRFGPKSELLIMACVFSGIGILLSNLVFLWMRKSSIGKVRMGIGIMLFPFLITLVFSILIIVITILTLNYV